MKIHPFIFSWKGQYEKTCETEEKLLKIFDKITIINSDEENKKDHWVNLDDEAYFTSQFCNAINLFDGDLMFHIQGDVTYYNWEAIVKSAKRYYSKYNYGIYAPNVDFTELRASRVNVISNKFKDECNLSLVSMTDCSCWFLNKTIIDSFKKNCLLQYAEGKYGWGIIACMSALSFLEKKYVLRDYNYTVSHPKKTGYDYEEAYTESITFHKSLNEKILNLILTVKEKNPDKILKIFNS
jgi:hypothetical protein